MTIPDALYSTGSMLSAVAGIVTALILSFKGKGLLLVSIVSCAVVFVVDAIIMLM